MKKAALVFVIATITAVSAVQAEVNVNVNLGVPVPRVVVSPPAPPRVIISAPPEVLFDVAPHFIAPSRLGFYVGVDTPYDIVFNADYYYLYYGNSWHRSRHHNGPWAEVSHRQLPQGIRKHRIEQIRSYRDQEYRVYHADRDHYRGRSFRAGHERREEYKDERRHEKQEFKDERRRDREEWKDEKRDRERGRHGRD